MPAMPSILLTYKQYPVALPPQTSPLMVKYCFPKKALNVEQWVTVCGFSFAVPYLELYKQHSNTSLQRSKGLKTKPFVGRTVVDD